MERPAVADQMLTPALNHGEELQERSGSSSNLPFDRAMVQASKIAKSGALKAQFKLVRALILLVIISDARGWGFSADRLDVHVLQPHLLAAL